MEPERTDDIGPSQQDGTRHGLRYSFLHNRSVRARVAGLVFIPLLGALIFGASVFYDAIRDLSTASSVERNTQTVRSVLTVIDRLQDERDVSALLRAGVNGDGAVASPRDQTDQALAELATHFEEVPQDEPSPFGNAIAEARQTLERGVVGLVDALPELAQYARAAIVVHRAPVVGIDQAEVPQLRPLVHVGDPRGEPLEEDLGERVAVAGVGDARDEGLDVPEEVGVRVGGLRGDAAAVVLDVDFDEIVAAAAAARREPPAGRSGRAGGAVAPPARGFVIVPSEHAYGQWPRSTVALADLCRAGPTAIGRNVLDSTRQGPANGGLPTPYSAGSHWQATRRSPPRQHGGVSLRCLWR